MCHAYGVLPDPVDGDEKAGVAITTLQLRPLNGLRHPRSNGTSGWYIWGGEELSASVDFFQPLHHAHITERCPSVERFLSLPAGWRFLVTDSHEDVWYDETLLACDD